MTAQLLTGWASIVLAVIVSIVMPMLLKRNQDRKEAATKAAELEEKADDTQVVSWESLNRALVKERDDLRIILRETEKRCAEQVVLADARHAKELLESEARYERELAKANGKITALQDQVSSLSARLYGHGGGAP